jgi:glucose-1-phosphate adenylyltransferase
LVQVTPVFNLYDKEWPIRTYQEQHPPAKTVFSDEWPGGRRALVLDSLVSHGCIISGARVERCVLSPDVRIENYSHVSESILMEGGQVGSWCRLKRCIVDKGVVIPDGTQIGHDREADAKRFLITEKGIAVVPKESAFAPA